MASKGSNGNQPAETQTSTREAIITLAGREYPIFALNMKAARAWRERFSEPIQEVLAVMRRMQDVELRDVSQAAEVLQQVGSYLLGSVDVLVEALFSYSPVLQADREWIEEHADDVEAMGALWEVLKLAYPFGGLVQLFNRGATTTGRSRS